MMTMSKVGVASLALDLKWYIRDPEVENTDKARLR